jgi:hypothetical protein
MIMTLGSEPPVDTSEKPGPPPVSWIKRVGWLVFVYILLLAGTLPHLIPPIPKTRLGWIVLFLLAPGYLLGGWLVERFSERFPERWGERTSLQKTLKAVCLIVVGLALIIALGLFRAGMPPG